jgi:hypothetical protein
MLVALVAMSCGADGTAPAGPDAGDASVSDGGDSSVSDADDSSVSDAGEADAFASDTGADGPAAFDASTPAVDGGNDGAPVSDGPASPGDAGPPDAAGVRCGSALCSLGDGGVPLYCCTTDLGVTGTCIHFGEQCVNPHYFYCDGRHNCVSSASCCFFQGGTSCLPVGSCPAANGETVCQTARECEDAGESCCPIADGSSIRVCAAGSCL